MKKFTITVKEVYDSNYTVEAKDTQEALKKVNELLQSGTPPEPSYNYTLPQEEWGIYETK